MIIFGKRKFGSTDRVTLGRERKPAFHVATIFFHIQFIPIVPLETYLFLDFLDGNQAVTPRFWRESWLARRSACQAVSIPTSYKSIGIAWIRCIAWYSFLILLLGLQSLILAAIALGLAIFVTFHDYFNDASYERAMELLEHANLGTREKALVKRVIHESFISQSTDDDHQLEALALPTATAELECSDDLELAEATVVPPGSNHDDPTVVAVVAVAQDSTKRGSEGPENGKEGPIHIV